MDCDNQAVQIVQFNRNNKFVLLIDELKQLLLHDDVRDREIVVLSVFGASRIGKSFLLNILIQYLNHRYKRGDSTLNWLATDDETLPGFSISAGKVKHTNGVWMWSDIYCSDLSDGRKIAIVLLDTQAVFDKDSSEYENEFIFGLMSLVSSIQIYNVQHLIRGNDLMHLQLDKYLSQNKSNEYLCQKLVFIVRDANLTEKDSFLADSGQRYLEEVMKKGQYAIKELEEVKELMPVYFDNIVCYLLPQPNVMMSMKNVVKVADLEENFRKLVKTLAKDLLAPETITLKKMNGNSMTAKELVTYFEKYMNQTGPRQLQQTIAQISFEKSTDNMIKEYTIRMKHILSNANSPSSCAQHHCEERDNILKTLKSQHKVTDMQEQTIVKNLDDIFENLRSSFIVPAENSLDKDIQTARKSYLEIMQLLFQNNPLNREEMRTEHEIQLEKVLRKFKAKHDAIVSEEKLRSEIEEAFAIVVNQCFQSNEKICKQMVEEVDHLLQQYRKRMTEVMTVESFAKISEIARRHNEVQSQLIEEIISNDKFMDHSALLTEYLDKFRATTNTNFIGNIQEYECRLTNMPIVEDTQMVNSLVPLQSSCDNPKGKKKNKVKNEKSQPIYNITINNGPQHHNVQNTKESRFSFSFRGLNGLSI